MSDTRNKIEEIISTLKQQRDELDLQMHLGAAEAKEEFDEAMQKLNKAMAAETFVQSAKAQEPLIRTSPGEAVGRMELTRWQTFHR